MMRPWWVHALRAIIVLTAIAEMLRGDVPYGIFCLAALGLTHVPVLVARRAAMRPPVEVELVLLPILVGDMTLGSLLRLYVVLPGYDKLLHLVTSMLLAGLGVYWAQLHGHARFRMALAGVTIVLATLGVGAVWEVAEFGVDRVLGRTAQSAPGLHAHADTMADLGMDLVGAMIGVVLGGLYVSAPRSAHAAPASTTLVRRT